MPNDSAGPRDLGAEGSDAAGARGDGSTDAVEVLSVYLELLRSGDEAAAQAHASSHGERREDLRAVRAAWHRLSPLLGHLDEAGLAERLATRFGSEVDPGISLSGVRGSGADDESHDSLAGPPTSGPAGEYRERFGRGGLAERRYKEPREIARGGMGSIRRVWDNDLRRELVMKAMLLPRDRTDGLDTRPPDSRLLSRFLEEAQVTSQLDHPGILPVHDIGVDADGRLFFTMPLVKGVDLGRVIELARAPDDPSADASERWDRTRVLSAIARAMEAVAFAHSRGVVHRDIKPENIMVGRFGETYVMDWGLARILEEERRKKPAPSDTLGAIDELRSRGASAPSPSEPTIQTDRTLERDADRGHATLDGDVIGTPGYMAPEQARGQHERVGPLADVYSFGAILYQLLTGHRPFDDPISRKSGDGLLDRVLQGRPTPIGKLDPTVPEELVAICNKAMRTDPSKRYGSMLELLEDVRASIENRVVRAYDTSARAMVVKWVRRNYLAASILFVSLVLGGTGTGLFIWQLKDSLAAKEDALGEARRQSEEAERSAQVAREAKAVADEQARAAEVARTEAEDAQAELERSFVELEREREAAESGRRDALLQGYAANLSAVQASIADDDLTEARRRLDRCPPELRDWEFEHLAQRIDMSLRAYREEGVHTGGVLDLASARDGQLVSIARDGVHTWDADTGSRLETWNAIRDPRFVHFVDGGDWILVVDGSGDVFRVVPGSADAQLLAAADVIERGTEFAADLSPDGRTLALATWADGELRLDLLDLATGAIDGATFAPEFARATAIAWHPTERAIAIGLVSEDGRSVFELIDPDRPNLARATFVTGAVTDLAFDERGENLAVTTDAGELLVWNRTDDTIPFLQSSSERALVSTCFDPDGELVYAGTANGTIEVWEVDADRRRLELRGHEGPVSVLDFDARRGQIVSGSADGSLRSWPPASGDVVQELALRDDRAMQSLFFLDEGRRIAVASADGGEVWDAAGLRQTARFEVPRGGALATLDALPWNNDLIGTIRVDDGDAARWSLHAWSSATGGRPRPRLTGSNGRPYASAVSSLRDLAVAFDRDSGTRGATSVFVYALGESTEPGATSALGPPQELEDLQRPVLSLAYDASGRRLAVGHDDGSVSIWSARSLRRLAVLVPPSVALDRARSRVVRDFANATSTLLTAAAPERVEVAVGARRPRGVTQLAFDPSGRFVVTGGRDGVVRLWDVEDATLLRSHVGHESAVTALAFHPDSGRYVSGSSDGTLRVWSTELDESLLVLRGHEGAIVDAGFDPRGRRLASIDREGTVRLHETEPQIERYSTQRDVAAAQESARPAIDQLLDNLARNGVSLSELFGASFPSLGAVKLLGSRPATLHDRAWEVVQRAGRAAGEYAIALDYARVAALLLPESAIYQRTLGIAQYRAGLVDEALETLDGEARDRLEPHRPEEIAVIGLCWMRRGETELATALLEEVADMCEEGPWKSDAVAAAFLAELEAALAQ